MVTILRSSQRRHVQRDRQETWHSFYSQDHPGPLADRMGPLVGFDELRIPRGDSTEPHSDNEAEVITYVHTGALSQEDTAGNSGVIHAGEFQRMSTGRRIRHKETSVSRSDCVHMFRVSIRPSEIGIDRQHVQKRFTEAQRRKRLCVVAAPDGRKGSLLIHQDALVCSAILDPGHHLVHELAPDRSAFLHIVCGEVTLDDTVLTQGDGVAFTNEPAVSLTVEKDAEVLLVDIGSRLMPFA